MNFKLPKIPNVSLSSVDKISSSVLNEVSKSVPNTITTTALNSLPDIITKTAINSLNDIDINEIVEMLFKKFLSDYNLSENMGIAVIIILICTIIIVPNLIVTFYSEYLDINAFYTYLIISVMCGLSLLSLKLNKEHRDPILYTNGVIGVLITLYAIFMGLTYSYND
jgi:hypothetical protein